MRLKDQGSLTSGHQSWLTSISAVQYLHAHRPLFYLWENVDMTTTEDSTDKFDTSDSNLSTVQEILSEVGYHVAPFLVDS